MTDFELIPVIDLMGGVVVHARAGERDSYRPLEGSLIASSAEPGAVIRGLLALHPFRTLYIADLDAIRKQGEHRAMILQLHRDFPDLRLWVDAGFAGECSCRRFLGAGVRRTRDRQREPGRPATARPAGQREPAIVLSLDFQGDRPLGAPDLFEQPERWPVRVIAMTLARVGAGGGPDLDRLRALRRRAPAKRLYAAGGVRGRRRPARTARSLGCAGALVASALHDGRLGRDALGALP